jgi:tRNA dimethylallyltransferase
MAYWKWGADMERLLAIVGPTAAGKTRLAVDLAKKLNGEIISGDSMQVYRGLDIGTAKADAEERQGIPHYLIDILDPQEEFSVVDFRARAASLITEIAGRGHLPILAGGTGLYVKALVEGYDFSAAPGSEAVRQRLEALAESHGNAYLHSLLAEVSPSTAARLHVGDRRRIIRALEVHELEGEEVSRSKAQDLVYETLVIGLNMNRPALYERINARVDTMVTAGLAEEVASLLAAGVSPDAQSLQAIGYKQFVAYVRGECDLATATAAVKQATRNFAKRQLTWFRKMPYIDWINIDDFADYTKMLAYIYSKAAGKFPPE